MTNSNLKSGADKAKSELLTMDISLAGVSATQKAIFARNLAIMLRSGLTISEALSINLESATGRFKKVISGLLESVESGNSLADSFSRYPKVFSGVFISATYAGEESGTLEENLEAIAKQLEKERELSSKIKQALLYPTVVLVAAFTLGLGLSFFILPKILPLFTGMKMTLPWSTRVLIAFSYFIQDYGVIFAISLVAFVALMGYIIKQKFSHPVTHWLLLHVPVVSSISRNSNLSRFCRNLSTLIKSGLSIDKALEIATDTVNNFYYQSALKVVAERLQKGTGLSDNLMQFPKLFPTMLTRMTSVGEKSGQLEETLAYLGDFYDTEVDNAAKNLTVAIEPLLLLFIGAVVAFLTLSIITPIYNITGNLH